MEVRVAVLERIRKSIPVEIVEEILEEFAVRIPRLISGRNFEVIPEEIPVVIPV